MAKPSILARPKLSSRAVLSHLSFLQFAAESCADRASVLKCTTGKSAGWGEFVEKFEQSLGIPYDRRSVVRNTFASMALS